MAKFFKYPFAKDGDKTSIPNPVQVDGTVSYDEGFGFNYQREIGVDPDALAIPRAQFNELMYDVTGAIQQWQVQAFPDWITSGDNDGTPYEYAAQAFVRYAGVVYQSLVGTNTATPGTDITKWRPFTNDPSFKVADVVETYDATLPDGWLWLDGKTIGSATSGATGRANADTSALFTSLWNSIPNASLPIQNSDGSAGARGLSAAADFAANKRLPVPDRRGRVAAGADNLGGTAANRLTNSRPGGCAGSLGNAGGEQAHTMITSEMTNHSHVLCWTGGQGTYIAPGDYLVANETALGSGVAYFLAGTNQTPDAGKVLETGGSLPFNVVQPTIVANFRIKL